MFVKQIPSQFFVHGSRTILLGFVVFRTKESSEQMDVFVLICCIETGLSRASKVLLLSSPLEVMRILISSAILNQCQLPK